MARRHDGIFCQVDEPAGVSLGETNFAAGIFNGHGRWRAGGLGELFVLSQFKWHGAMMEYFAKSTNLLVCPSAKQISPPGFSTVMGGGGQVGSASYSYYRNLNGTA